MVQYIRDLPWRNIWLVDNHVETLNEHRSLLVGRHVPTQVIRVHNKDKPWFNVQCRHVFGLKLEVHLRWTCDSTPINWEEFVHCQVRANETYSEVKRQFSDRNRDVLMKGHSPQKWWSTLSLSWLCSARVRHCLHSLVRGWTGV